MAEKEIGKVSDFFARPVVAGIELTGNVKVGDTLHVHGHTTELMFTIDSMQINNVNVDVAKKGDLIGIKVPERVRPGDTVYIVN
jgi:selenocysteine-specific translation elongation factor